MKKPLLFMGLIGIIMIAGLAYFFQSNTQTSPVNTTNQNNVMERIEPTTSPDNSAGSETTQSTGEVKTFTIESQNMSFSMKEIRVKKGDRVKIILVNKQGFHDWVVDEFSGAKTKQIGAGSTETIEFTADKVGTFQFYCSVGNHRSMGMVGNFIVE